jgi:hypothetical protein
MFKLPNYYKESFTMYVRTTVLPPHAICKQET